MDKIPVVVIVGTTACGKTDLAVEICKRHNGEVVSADSMQIYKKLDIGTAKPSRKQLEEVKHHMIDILNPNETFSVAQYCKAAHKILADIHKRGKLPVVAGGTGLYVNSLINNIEFVSSDVNLKLRDNLSRRAENEGIDILIDEISKSDPLYAEKLSLERNKKHIIRALEIMKTTGKTMSEYLKDSVKNDTPYVPLFIGLTFENRDLLYDMVNKRVDLMLLNGLCREAEFVMSLDENSTAKSAIGYKEIFPYINGEKSLEDCVEDLKRASRRYAKRQLTWFRRNKDIKWIFIDEYINMSNSDRSKKIYGIVRDIMRDVKIL